MAVATGAYVGSALSIRALSPIFTVFDIGLIRILGGIAICAPFVLSQTQLREDFRNTNFQAHGTRALVHFLGSIALIASFRSVPLGIVSAIEFTAPLWAALACFALYGERQSRISIVGLFIIGVAAALILHANLRDVGGAVFLPLSATILLTASNMLVGMLARTTRPIVIFLILNFFQLPVYAVCAGVSGTHLAHFALTQDILGPVAMLAASGTLTQLAIARALQIGTATQMTALDTIRIPSVAIAAFLVYGQVLNPETLFGAAAVAVGVLIVMAGRDRRSEPFENA